MGRMKNTINADLTMLGQEEVDLLENMKELMLDAEVVEEFEESVWLKVDAELWRIVMEGLR